MIIIDNLVQSFANDIENGIPIRPYTSGKEDYELEFIADILQGIGENTDCRSYLSSILQLHNFYNRC